MRNEKSEMRNSIAHIKAKAFAVRIVKFTQFFAERKARTSIVETDTA